MVESSGGEMIRKARKIQDYAIVVLLLVIVVFFAQLYLPVTFLMKAEQVSRVESAVTMRVSGYKLRDCEVVKGSPVGWYVIGGEPIETSFEFVDDLTPDSSKPKSLFERQSFGLWKWEGLPEFADEVRLTIKHTCGSETKTRIVGTWPIER